MQWPAQEISVRIEPGRCKTFRAVIIDDGTFTYMFIAASISRARRDALDLIQRECGSQTGAPLGNGAANRSG